MYELYASWSINLVCLLQTQFHAATSRLLLYTYALNRTYQ
jgi:hypothetical protein